MSVPSKVTVTYSLATLRAPYWVKLVRSGNTFKAYQSANGTTWAQVGPTETITMASTIYVGLAVTSHVNTALNTSLFSNVSVTAIAKPPAPVLNSATPGDGQVSLSWNAFEGVMDYRVRWGTQSGVYTSGSSWTRQTSLTVTGLTNGTRYYFVADAFDRSGAMFTSNEVSAVPAAPAPAAPVLDSAVPGDGQVSLAWSGAAAATGYKIHYGTAPGSYASVLDAGDTRAYTLSGLTNGTTYYFAVTAYNSGGESTRSNELSATPAAPVVIVPEEPTLFVKNADYNAAGQITKIEYGNGDVTTYTYDPLTLRLTRLSTSNASGETLQDLNYTYDSAGNILSITDKVHTATQNFKYDELNRLTEAAGGYGTKAYVYDTIGNIVEKDGKTYFYGDGVSAGPHAVTALSDGTTFTYDANGNLTQQTQSTQTTQYAYDSENRLLEVKKSGSIIARYEYDGDGGRTQKTAKVGNQTTTTTFVGSLFEKDDVRSTKYVFLGDQRIASVTNGTVLYYHADHLGGTNVLTDATGLKKELIEYEPFGLESRHEKYGSSEEVAWYYFTGKPKDDETGLYYFGARYYDPALGRFITADTVVQAPYDPQSLNRYSYTSNNPINRIDPDGHKWNWTKFWHAAVGAIVGVAAAIVLGPGGVGLGLTMAGIIGGATGGAITGGLEGGWQGALIGAATGGALGGVGGWAVAGGHSFVLGGMFLAGTGLAAATDSWDSYAGGFVGGITGAAVGNGIVSAYSEQFSNFRAGSGFRADRAVRAAQYKKALDALNVNESDKVKVTVGSRPLGKDAAGNPGSPTGPRHEYLRWTENGQEHIWEMGSQKGNIQTRNTAVGKWDTATTTDLSIGTSAAKEIHIQMSLSGLKNSISTYESYWVGQPYRLNSYNSNYAVNSILYGNGANSPPTGIGHHHYGYPDSP